jgi:hypothetical protein
MRASSANITAVSFVVSAIMPARCPQGNQAVRSELLIVMVKNWIKGSRHSLPSLIASHSQLQQGSQETPLNGTVQ